MGCACSSGHLERDRINSGDDSFSFAHAASTSGAAIVTEGTEDEKQMLHRILQLSVQLSLMAAEQGRSELDLCKAVVAARGQLTSADRMTVWRTRPGGAGSEGKLVAIASDADVLIGRTLELTDPAPPCAAVSASTSLDSPPLMIDLTDEVARRELEARYGPVRAVLYVPVNAPRTATAPAGDDTDATQMGVVELVMLDKVGSAAVCDACGQDRRSSSSVSSGASSTPSGVRGGCRSGNGGSCGAAGGGADGGVDGGAGGSGGDGGAQNGGGSTANGALNGEGVHSRCGGDLLVRQQSGGSCSFNKLRRGSVDDTADYTGGYSLVARRHLGQLGTNLATALQTLVLADKNQQGERLLYRMLPQHIVSQLQKRGPEDFLVESCDKAFVLYSDIVSFTSYCSSREPRDVVVMLNSMFATFDALLSKHNVHKVTTIGDAYVAATGLNFMDSDAPHLDIVAFALDMVAAVSTFTTEDGERMQIRIGIHVGPVAAGVVGIAMPRYCLFGETVTIAEQLEERSAAGKILISGAMHESLHNGTRRPLSDSLMYEQSEERVQLSGSTEALTSTYFLNARAHRRRQASLAFLEEMATEKLSYFKDRTDDRRSVLARESSISIADRRTSTVEWSPAEKSTQADSRNTRSRRASRDSGAEGETATLGQRASALLSGGFSAPPIRNIRTVPASRTSDRLSAMSDRHGDRSAVRQNRFSDHDLDDVRQMMAETNTIDVQNPGYDIVGETVSAPPARRNQRRFSTPNMVFHPKDPADGREGQTPESPDPPSPGSKSFTDSKSHTRSASVGFASDPDGEGFVTRPRRASFTEMHGIGAPTEREEQEEEDDDDDIK